LSNSLSGDTLTIELLSQNVQYAKKPHLEFVFNKDTLNITRTPESRQKDTIIYNKEKNKYDTLHFVEMSRMEIRELDPKYKLETFRFYKQRKKPTTIYVNGKLYKNCPTKDIEFKTYKGKIINRINKDGVKDGVWLQFHENGKIKEEKYYDNGRFLNGKTFDSNGKDLHYVSESSGGIVTLQMDSLTNK
jgi:antitoxin component YwqK of YwqJK toxin-antitoxin module